MRLLEVCRARNTPIITFINKLDREGKEPLALLDEIERDARHAHGAVHLAGRHGQALRRRLRHAQRPDARLPRGRGPPPGRRGGHRRHRQSRQRRGASAMRSRRRAARSSCSRAPRTSSIASEFLAGKQTPVFFGSAINNFGVKEILDALIDLAPAPGPQARGPADRASPTEEKFTGVVFKIQANMDPAHRDRVAFVRVASGRFRARHEGEARAHGQGSEDRERGLVPVAAPRGARGRVAGRHRRHSQSRRAAAGRHDHRGRDAAVHGAAVLRARDLLQRGGGRSHAQQAASRRACSSWARRARSRSSVRCTAGRCCWAPWGSCRSTWWRIASRASTRRQARMTPSNFRLARWITAEDPAGAAALHRRQRASAWRTTWSMRRRCYTRTRPSSRRRARSGRRSSSTPCASTAGSSFTRIASPRSPRSRDRSCARGRACPRGVTGFIA